MRFLNSAHRELSIPRPPRLVRLKKGLGTVFQKFYGLLFLVSIIRNAKILSDPKVRNSSQILHKLIGGCRRLAPGIVDGQLPAAGRQHGVVRTFQNRNGFEKLVVPPPTSEPISLCKYGAICISHGENNKLGHIYISL